MPEVLDFNPNRDLGFDPRRRLGFDMDRNLGFDPNDGLFFDHNRDLGFGKRGPVFRGFVCPVCASSVTEDQPSCTVCGAIFETPKPSKIKQAVPPPGAYPAPPAVPPPPSPAPPPPVRRYPPAPKSVDMTSCVFCGSRVGYRDEFCWQCGKRIRGAR